MICTDIKKIDSLQDGSDVLEVTIDNMTNALWIYPMADAVPYIGKEVIVSYRNDMYLGQIRPFVNTFVLPCKVSTLDKKDGIKLYANATDNFSNMSFNDIACGETKNGCIVYCISQKFETSEKSVWVTLLVRDKMFRVAKLRLFHYDKSIDFSGSYIICAMTRNDYGFKTDMVAPAVGECPDNYEIKIAEEFILNYFAGDDAAMQYITKMHLIAYMKDYMDVEKGYIVVRLAQELSLCDALYNITNGVDIKAISHALLADKSFVRNPKSVLSESARNVHAALGHAWPAPEIVLTLLDASCANAPGEKDIYLSIKSTVNNIIRTSKCVY